MVKAKIEAAIAIKNINDQQIPVLLKVPVTRLQKNEGSEVWYNNKLYDVVKSEQINDTGYVYLLRDEDEESILADNSVYFTQQMGCFSNGAYLSATIKNKVMITDTNYLVNAIAKLFPCGHFLQSPTVTNKFHFTSVDADVLTPPPKIFQA